MAPLRGSGRFLALNSADRWLLVRAFVWLSLVDLALRAFGPRWLITRAGDAPALTTPTADTYRRARAYARSIGIASRRHPLRPACLARAVVLHGWLSQEGLPSALRIGVRKENSELKAHAWVELAGRAINERSAALASFTPLAPFGSTRAAGLGRPWSTSLRAWTE